jgi:hypothetical protein
MRPKMSRLETTVIILATVSGAPVLSAAFGIAMHWRLP